MISENLHDVRCYFWAVTVQQCHTGAEASTRKTIPGVINDLW